MLHARQRRDVLKTTICPEKKKEQGFRPALKIVSTLFPEI
jgi:hypothetical protein